MSIPAERHEPETQEPPQDFEVFGERVVWVVAAWLVIGIVALGSEAFQNSFVVVWVVTACVTVQLYQIPKLFGRMHHYWPGRGDNYFLAGFVGLVLTTVSAIAYHADMSMLTIFWCCSGNYIGWFFEVMTGVFGSYICNTEEWAEEDQRLRTRNLRHAHVRLDAHTSNDALEEAQEQGIPTNVVQCDDQGPGQR